MGPSPDRARAHILCSSSLIAADAHLLLFHRCESQQPNGINYLMAMNLPTLYWCVQFDNVHP